MVCLAARMKCIVTAGPTFEPLDEVRRLTNFSTGRLGSELATFLSGQGHEVILLIGQQATWRGERKAKVVESFTTTGDLKARLLRHASKEIGAVFHAAAVSDFGFGKIWHRTKTYAPPTPAHRTNVRLGADTATIWPLYECAAAKKLDRSQFARLSTNRRLLKQQPARR